MSGLAFLGLAAVVSLAGSLLVLARHRRRGIADDSIEDFSRTMRALSPEHRPPDPS